MIQVEIIHRNYSIESPICIEGGGLHAHRHSKEPKEEGGNLVISLFDVYSDYRLGNALLHIWNVYRASVPPGNLFCAFTAPSMF